MISEVEFLLSFVFKKILKSIPRKRNLKTFTAEGHYFENLLKSLQNLSDFRDETLGCGFYFSVLLTGRS